MVYGDGMSGGMDSGELDSGNGQEPQEARQLGAQPGHAKGAGW